jgi:hypothetical protein
VPGTVPIEGVVVGGLEHESLERELTEARAREAQYRTDLSEHAALGARLRGYSESLQRLLRSRPPSRRHLSQTLLEVARLSSQALTVERTSIWLLDDSRKQLGCIVQITATSEESPEGLSLPVASCSVYMRAGLGIKRVARVKR